METKGQLPPPRCWSGSCIVDSNLYIFGGYDGKKTITSFLSDLYILNLGTALVLAPVLIIAETLRWTEVVAKGSPPSPRYAHSMNVVGKRIFLFGGAAGRLYYNSVHVFDTGESAGAFSDRKKRTLGILQQCTGMFLKRGADTGTDTMTVGDEAAQCWWEGTSTSLAAITGWGSTSTTSSCWTQVRQHH